MFFNRIKIPVNRVVYSWALDNDIERFRKNFKEVFGI